MEQQIENVCEKVDGLENRMLVIDQKLDAALMNKADKSELVTINAKVDKADNRFWLLIWGILGGAVTIVLAVAAYVGITSMTHLITR